MDIIYFKTGNSSFILTDQKILEQNFSVKTYYINNSNAVHYVFALAQLLIFLSLFGRKPRVYFIRFADWHTALLAFFRKLYRKKLVIVVGGFDAFHLPEYEYGVYHRPFRGWCAKYALRNASLVLPNSPSLIEYTNYYASDTPIRGGIKYFVPDIKARIRVVPNGFDTHYWAKDPQVKKKNIVLTVAFVNSLRNFRLKGIDSFIHLASLIPGTEFVMIGMHAEFLARYASDIPIPRNLKIIEYVSRDQLLKFYGEAMVFCLLSLSEGMSNVLCEAMLCECIPVGSHVTFIPELIGDTGFIVRHRDMNEMREKVEDALNSDPDRGKLARARILNNYSSEIRTRILCELVREELKT